MLLLFSKKTVWTNISVFLLTFVIFITFLIKFSYLFSGETVSGWDTPGHVILAKEFVKLTENGTAIGWSDVWFGGFPIFYFYPPFYYFLVYLIHLVFSIPVESAFSVSIFFTIVLLAIAIYQFGSQFFWRRFPVVIRIIIGMLSILFYFNYAGEGLQGTSIVGIIEGTVISSFTHALFLFGILFLDSFRKKNHIRYLVLFVSVTSLVFYSHLLSSIFYSLILFIYLVVYRKFWVKQFRFLFVSFSVIFLLICPVLYQYFRYSEYTSSVFYGYSYPPVLSILSRDVYDQAVKASQLGENITLAFVIELFRSGRWLYLFVLIALTFHLRSLQNYIRSRFLTTLLLVFFWMSLDYSFGYIFPNIKIHNYRAFDSFFITFSILMPVVLVYSLRIQKKFLPLFPVLVFVLLSQFYLFVTFDPFVYQEYKSPLWKEARPKEEIVLYDRLSEKLKQLPPGSIVQPEIIKTKSVFGGPHFWIPLFYNAGVKNNLGLTVESSYYSTLVFNWQSFGFAHTFRWGTDIDWRDSLVLLKKENENGYFLDFLLRSGVSYMMGFSPDYTDFLKLNQNRIELISKEGPFQIVKILPNQNSNYAKPIGLIHADTLNQNKDFSYQSFLKISNLLQMYLSNLGYQIKIVRISREHLENLDSIFPSLSSLLLVTDQNGLGERSWLNGIQNKNIPNLLLVNSEITNEITQTEDKLKQFLNKIPKTDGSLFLQENSSTYFAEKKSENGILLLDDTAKEYWIQQKVGDVRENKDVKLSKFPGHIYFSFMLLSFIIFLSGFVFTKIAYFSFSKANK
ncbi:hypothetical protein AB3N60_12740 [Leptospira sp. WS39.C2]